MNNIERHTISHFRKMKKRGEIITMLTAYDYPSARILDRVGIPIILVGDSLGMVVLGYDSTIPVTMEEMIHHSKAVVRGNHTALITVDMPFMSYQVSPEQALENAGRIIKETDCQAVKLEGGAHMITTIRKIVDCGIPVMGHLGLTPQSVHQLSGYRAVGKSKREAKEIFADAQRLQDSGCFAIVLEAVPEELAGLISEDLLIPTIGIASGRKCDGQVQVIHDILGLYDEFVPKHTKIYNPVGESIERAVREYTEEVRAGKFPTADQGISIKSDYIDEIRLMLSEEIKK